MSERIPNEWERERHAHSEREVVMVDNKALGTFSFSSNLITLQMQILWMLYPYLKAYFNVHLFSNVHRFDWYIVEQTPNCVIFGIFLFKVIIKNWYWGCKQSSRLNELLFVLLLICVFFLDITQKWNDPNSIEIPLEHFIHRWKNNCGKNSVGKHLM